ncbi:MAG: S-adenosylmethionine:tRNA ribosyltransferase-isomerase [Chloroflexales bacterium]|nr:S-adenosylmethionine:tRNA ribosyltransferase-isomerase [Chloroflexales bacterium]
MTLTLTFPALDFELPPALEAGEPPEARGLARDEVRLMVSHYSDDRVRHERFRSLPCFLEAGDLLLVNTSGTLNAALPATRPDGASAALHLSTRLPAGLWSVELRERRGKTTAPCLDAARGEVLALPAGGRAILLTPYRRDGGPARLWVAELQLPTPLEWYLEDHGAPISYSYVGRPWPSAYYQTVFANEPGSAEMPSAGRAFTAELVTRLVAQGVQIAPLVLHTGVASLESHEPPYEEYYRVSAPTARAVNLARTVGRRVIAVGTTVARAIESVAEPDGTVHPGEGWTGLVITPERGLRAIDGMLTGLHEPRATHLALLAALCGVEHLRLTYGEALAHSYLWHEFGDLHLILP